MCIYTLHLDKPSWFSDRHENRPISTDVRLTVCEFLGEATIGYLLSQVSRRLVSIVINVVKTIPETTHDWEWFVALKKKTVMDGDGKNGIVLTTLPPFLALNTSILTSKRLSILIPTFSTQRRSTDCLRPIASRKSRGPTAPVFVLLFTFQLFVSRSELQEFVLCRSRGYSCWLNVEDQ